MDYKRKVTIGIAVKNGEATINKALVSVLQQEFSHELMEIIVVDGCSKDRTVQIVKKSLETSIINYRILSENTGLGYARNLIVNNAVGEYIVWVDADMVISPSYVKKLVEYMDNNPEVGISKGQYRLYNKSSIVSLLEDVEFVLKYSDTDQKNARVLATSGSIYRTRAIKDINGFDEKIQGAGEDMDAEYRIKEQGWTTQIVAASFYEQRRTSWKSLWNEYFWFGKGEYYLFNKNRELYPADKLFFPFLILDSIVRISKAYKIIHRKEVILLPFHYMYKRIAWLFGFLSAKYF